MNRTLPAAMLAAACALTAACTTTNTPTPAQTNPKVGITTHATITASPDPVLQQNDWWTGGAKARLNAITTDLGKIRTDGHDYTAYNTDCGTLSTDVTAALAYKPNPDAQAQTHWATSLSDLQQAATDCQAGATTLDASVIAKAGVEIRAGNTELSAAMARMTALVTSG